MQSALERELAGLATRIRNGIRGHDRGVVLAFLLCIAPLPPVMVVGAAIMLVNAILFGLGRLPRREWRLILLGLVIASLTTWFWFRVALFIDHIGPFEALRDLLGYVLGTGRGGDSYQHIHTIACLTSGSVHG